MADLDLKELDRLEREMQGKVMSTNVNDIHEQLRPLLDLVDRMGEALAKAELDLETFGDEGHVQDITQVHNAEDCDICFANEAADRARTTLDDYRRAKGEA